MEQAACTAICRADGLKAKDIAAALGPDYEIIPVPVLTAARELFRFEYLGFLRD